VPCARPAKAAQLDLEAKLARIKKTRATRRESSRRYQIEQTEEIGRFEDIEMSSASEREAESERRFLLYKS